MKPNAEKNPGRQVPLSVVTLNEIDEAMMMGTKSPRSAAEVIFENCFIRGEGDVVVNPAGRPLDLKLDNVLAGLTGSLVNLQAGTKEAMPDKPVRLSLLRSSLFTSEPLIVARQGKNRYPKGLPKVFVERINNCLFTGLEDKPFILTEYADLSDGTLRNHLDWKGANNAYVGFERMLEDNVSMFRLNRRTWEEAFYSNAAPLKFVGASFPMLQASRQLWLIAPDDFKAKTESSQQELQPFGATLELDQLPPIESKNSQ
jgi:hypothetical protein